MINFRKNFAIEKYPFLNRKNHRNSLIGKLLKVFGGVFSYERLLDASDEIDYHLNEDPDIIKKHTWEKRYEQAMRKLSHFLFLSANILSISNDNNVKKACYNFL